MNSATNCKSVTVQHCPVVLLGCFDKVRALITESEASLLHLKNRQHQPMDSSERAPPSQSLSFELTPSNVVGHTATTFREPMVHEEVRWKGGSTANHWASASSILHDFSPFPTTRKCVPTSLGTPNERSCISYAGLAAPPEADGLHDALQASHVNNETEKSNEETSEHGRTHEVDEGSTEAREAAKEHLRKQRSRIHQERHQMKKRKIVTDLEGSVKKLRKDIDELRMQHRIVQLDSSANSTVWNVAAEFFRLFRNAFNASVKDFAAGMLQPRESPAQRGFLQVSMTPDVIGSTGYGVESLLEDWRLISLYHEDIDIQLISLENGPGNSLIATTKDRVTISANTLRYVFPHLMYGGSEEVNVSSRLLGQQFSLRGTFHFRWDEESGRVMSVQCKGDWLTPMLNHLGSLEDVSRVFNGAFITLDCDLVVREDLKLPSGSML